MLNYKISIFEYEQSINFDEKFFGNNTKHVA